MLATVIYILEKRLAELDRINNHYNKYKNISEKDSSEAPVDHENRDADCSNIQSMNYITKTATTISIAMSSTTATLWVPPTVTKRLKYQWSQ